MAPTSSAAHRPTLVELEVADEPEAWAAAGFAVQDGAVRLADVVVRLSGRGDPTGLTGRTSRGIVGWTLAGAHLDGDHLDGLPTRTAEAAPAAPADLIPADHPNGAVAIDHVVVLTPDLQRTIDAIEAAGIGLRRIRDTERRGTPMRQAFFRLGPVILEVVSGDLGTGAPAGESPASFFGLAVAVDDLDATKATLGEGIGDPKPAVQEGQRIATLRHRAFDISVAVAAMDRHGDR